MKAKKVLAMLMASAMIMGTSMTVFAEPGVGVKPTSQDAENVTIENLQDGATMKAYQIIDASYDTNGFTGYEWATGVNWDATDVTAGEKVVNANNQITSEMITSLASNPNGLNVINNFTNGSELEVGTWMILVTPPATNPTKVYNPMIVSVYYALTNTSGDSTLVVEGLDASDSWKLETTDAYTKSSTIPSGKTVDDAENEVGEKATFHLTGTIPSYNATYYKNPTYALRDTIVNGLEYVLDADDNLEVEVSIFTKDGVEKEEGVFEDGYVPVDSSNYTVQFDSQKPGTFTISFNSDYITGLANLTDIYRQVRVDYQAVITEEAVEKVGENKVEVVYSTTPSETTTADPKFVYTATFSLDGVLQKVKENETGLAGATFTLYREYNDKVLSDVFGTVETDEEKEFDIEFKGLDYDRPYYLKETAAPEGYSINETVYKIEFENLKYENDDSTKKPISYDVKVTEADTGKLVGNKVTISYGQEASQFGGHIVNTALSTLPSTGGIGPTIFTIGGCAIMITAAGLYFATRKKVEK